MTGNNPQTIDHDFRIGWNGAAAAAMYESVWQAGEGFRLVNQIEFQVNPEKRLLVVVHPGSLMGSYASAYDDAHWHDEDTDQTVAPELMDDPTSIRDATADLILSFDGEVVCVLGDFSDEIHSVHPSPANAVWKLEQALSRIGAEGVMAIAEPDRGSLEAAADWIAETLDAADRPEVVMAGAWADRNDGCVRAVAERLAYHGATVRLAPCVAWSSDEAVPRRGRADGQGWDIPTSAASARAKP